MDDNNIFDEDDALDYILQEDTENQPPANKSGFGCMAFIILPIISPIIWYLV